jgi:hypothetical protein
MSSKAFPAREPTPRGRCPFRCRGSRRESAVAQPSTLDHMGVSYHSGAVSRRVIIWLAIPFIIMFLILGGRAAMKHRYKSSRRNWKDEALGQITRTSMTNEEVRTEIDQIKHPTPNLNFGWTHQHVLLMTNGEFLVYAFRHGFNNGFVDHLFLAHGSDGRWLYSTYHFCNSMAGVVGDDPPGSISEFSTRYTAREFDGKSDECLQHTWP